ncbi:MAG: alanyl-tRNA editing protein [Firmicutes bacterium]|nr:alanyl-tRNA editing protein [Bacillota bacterium]
MILIRRYYTDPWMQELETQIISSCQDAEGHCIVLEETIFYPTGGGQPHDLGSINGVPLIDVFEQDGVIFHVLPQPLEGKAFCVLDWNRRLDHMQQHSGQHLLSAVFEDEYGYRTESFHLGEEYCSIDIGTPSVSSQEKSAVETRANQVIFANLPLLTYTLSPKQHTSVPLRKIPDLEGDLRIVEIKGFDYSPCSGTHVKSTGQIGLVKIIRWEKYKGMTRVYFLCGDRALRDYGRKHEICTNLVGLLAVPETELHSRIALEIERRHELAGQVEALKAELIGYRAQEIVEQGNSPFFIEDSTASIEEAQQLARSILNLANGTVVIKIDQRLVLAHNQGKDLHLGQLIKEQAQPLGGRGGGSPTGAQVFFPDGAGLADFWSLLQTLLKSD